MYGDICSGKIRLRPRPGPGPRLSDSYAEGKQWSAQAIAVGRSPEMILMWVFNM